MRPVVTASDLEKISPGGELGIASDALITPLARDEAARRNITLRVVRDAADQPIPGVTASPKPSGDVGANSAGHKIVAIAADHGGFELKEQLEQFLKDWGYSVIDLGTKN